MNRFFDGMPVLLSGMMLLCATGCCSYRYSATVKSGISHPYDFGSYNIRNITVDSSKSFLKSVNMNEVLQIAGENGVDKGKDGKNIERIRLVLRETMADFNRKEGIEGLLYVFSFGAVPITEKDRIYVTAYVYKENSQWCHDKFQLAIERKKRFTPFILWPFLPVAAHKDEIFAIDNTVMEGESRGVNGVIGYAISSGLTNDFKNR